MSCADQENRGLCKSLDGFCVLGPWLTTADEIPDPAGLCIGLEFDAPPTQQGHTGQMLHDAASLEVAASAWFALNPGDVLLTGALAGFSLLVPGGRLCGHFVGLGTMSVIVRAAS